MGNRARGDTPAWARPWRRRELLAAAGAAGLGLLAACGPKASGSGSAPSGSSGSASQAGPAGTPQQVANVRAGVIAGLSENVFQYLGQERGFFRDEGIDVEFIEFQAGGPMLKALGALDAENRKSLLSDLGALITRLNRSGDATMVVPAEYLEVVIVVA